MNKNAVVVSQRAPQCFLTSEFLKFSYKGTHYFMMVVLSQLSI